ncbi:hypothetical protein TorRG33x02_330990 [Trema orientale]|uniref:Uncharacterized protein n=1 Tax=Trema orientale TaxID=63057 RepID=A0A2P5B6B9_TREOI|nr:hypothetical protein TorRG33x02_330990 [Trema orientale]
MGNIENSKPRISHTPALTVDLTILQLHRRQDSAEQSRGYGTREGPKICQVKALEGVEISGVGFNQGVAMAESFVEIFTMVMASSHDREVIKPQGIQSTGDNLIFEVGGITAKYPSKNFDQSLDCEGKHSTS